MIALVLDGVYGLCPLFRYAPVFILHVCMKDDNLAVLCHGVGVGAPEVLLMLFRSLVGRKRDFEGAVNV